MQPEDIGRLVSAAEPRVSPDGALVAFVVTRVDLPANRYRTAIWLAAADGSSAPYPATTGEDRDAEPVWSPDGRRLAFTRSDVCDDDGGGRHRLLVLPVAGPGETVAVCARDEPIGEVTWSPDGARLAFSSRLRAPRWSEGDDDRSRPPRRVDRLLPRLDGEGWIVDRPRAVFAVRADGTAPPVVVLDGPSDHSGPAWSPDSTALAVSGPRGEDQDLEHVCDVHVVGDEGLRTLTDGALSVTAPAFSPDGARLAVLAEDVRVGPSHGRVGVVDTADGELRLLTGALDRQCAPRFGTRAPIWDGEHLVFAVEDHGDQHLYRVPADGSAPPELLAGGRRAITGWDLAGGTLALVSSGPTSLPEVSVVRDGTERTLTRLGADFGASVPAVGREHFTVASPAGDGDVDAWLMLPGEPAEGADGRMPVLLSIHGGPASQYTSAWFDEFALWTGAGYAVVFANPHGSTGHTDAWALALRAPEAAVRPGSGWGGVDADDVLAVLDAALEREPALDPSRVGVLGGSYGGYLTSWLVARTDRFAAACSERSANDLDALAWDSDGGGLLRLAVGVSHLDHPEYYRRASPATYARDIHTPLLIVHSEDDLRTPPAQADALFVALRLLGRTVEYWRFPAEGHELSRSGSPRHRVQRAELILDWFGRHLGGRRPRITWDHPSRTPAG